MALDIASIDTKSMVNFLDGNGDEIGLLIFAAIQCIVCVAKFLFSKREKTIDMGSKFSSFLWDGLVYFPTLILLVANLFFDTSRNLLTGYVLGASLHMVLSLWQDQTRESEYQKEREKIIKSTKDIEQLRDTAEEANEKSKGKGLRKAIEILSKTTFTLWVCVSLIFS